MKLLSFIGNLLFNPFFVGTAFTGFFCYTAFLHYATIDNRYDAHQSNWAVRKVREFHMKTIDWRLQARGLRAGSDRVVVLSVDEKSLEQEGRWPWPRAKIKHIVSQLMDYGASVIAFDIIFAEEVRNAGVVALETLQERYGGNPKFNAIVAQEIENQRTDQDLGAAIAKYGDRLVMGAYFDNPYIERFSRGYQNLCMQKLYQNSSAFEHWENQEFVIIPIDQTAMNIPDEMPEVLSEALTAHFNTIGEKELQSYLRERKEKGLSTKEMTTTMKIEAQNRTSFEQWRYCSRWLTEKDENIEIYKKIWPQVIEEDETLAGLSVDDGIEFFKDRQLNMSIPLTGRWWLNTESIGKDTKHTGYFNAFLDSDGTVRKSSLFVRSGTSLFPSLALRTFLIDKGLVGQVTLDQDAKYPESKSITSLVLSDEEGEEVGSIPVNAFGDLIINYAGPQKMFPHLSVADILNDDDSLVTSVRRFDEKTKKWRFVKETHKKADFIKDKIFVFGATATGIYDLRVTPFEENFPGVETHANLIDNLLRKDFLIQHPQEEVYMPVLILVVGILFSFLISRFGAATGLIVTVSAMTGIYWIDQNYLFGRGYVTAVIFPVILVGALYFVLTVYKYFTEERSKKQLKGTFGKYVSPAIVDEILSDPAKIELGGQKKVISVFFSDVRGFTTISEKLDAATLSDLLNSYLTPMTELVFENKGTLDKYMGDAIMAFFGAPIDTPDHAHNACRCALQNLEKLKVLQAQYERDGLPMIDVGIGINTGEMSVGNMGSETVRNYTVMGDAVNLGSRLEGINKQYGTRIIISEFTHAEIKDDFYTREIDWVRVKGKAEPVKIYELVSEEKPAQDMLDTLKWFDQGFVQYHDQKWEAAIESFSQALNCRPSDPVSQLYLKRCYDYRHTPPPENWDGVFTMTTK